MTTSSKTVVFFGNEKLATGLPVAEPIIRQAVEAAGFEIEQIVTGKLSDLRPHTSRLAVLAAYGQIIPQRVLDEFPLGIINIHPSLLPQYRGPTPIESAMLDGQAKTGVSIMQLTAGMDAGPIYKQKTLQLTGNESKAELTKQLQALGAELLIEVLPEIASGTLKPRQQPHPDRATYSRKLEKADGEIDWSKSAEILEREVRAYLGWPGSRTQLAGKDVTILQVHIEPQAGKPGVTALLNKQLMVFCGKDALIIDALKPAGKKEMTGKEFLAGHKHLLV